MISNLILPPITQPLGLQSAVTLAINPLLSLARHFLYPLLLLSARKKCDKIQKSMVLINLKTVLSMKAQANLRFMIKRMGIEVVLINYIVPLNLFN